MNAKVPHGGGDDLQAVVESLAQRIAELEARVPDSLEPEVARPLSDETLAEIADKIYRRRRRRDEFFSPGLFAEPAWDMLLDLFISKARGRRVLTTSLCIAANVPQATGLRWIAQLEEHGLVRRCSAPDDGRVKLVEITPEAYRRMRHFVTDGVKRAEMPFPG